MGTGFTRSGLNSRVFTNSFSAKNASAYSPFYKSGITSGNSFYGLTKIQYNIQMKQQLSSLGAGAGNRGGRWNFSKNKTVNYI